MRPNPNSAVVWVFEKSDLNGNGKFEYEETMHRSISRVAIENDLLFAASFSGFAFCLDAKTGKLHWTHDLLAACWSSPIIAGQHVYLGDEDGDMTVFALDRKLRTDSEMYLENSIYSTPAVAQNVLYIATKNKLYAIKDLPPPAKSTNQITGK